MIALKTRSKVSAELHPMKSSMLVNNTLQIGGPGRIPRPILEVIEICGQVLRNLDFESSPAIARSQECNLCRKIICKDPVISLEQEDIVFLIPM